jgi:putative ubiquitin-RnfH superfamily antitoxin RatB of RatAB toxin-antitoxin module
MQSNPSTPLQVLVAYSLRPRHAVEACFDLPAGATAGSALAAALAADAELVALEDLQLSIWGKAASAAKVLAPGDRLEITRALRVDPKVARRERFEGQGARSTGLFAKRRKNAAFGYGA